MIKRLGTAALFFAAFSTVAAAGGLPEVKAGAANRVPACATPGRLMAYLKERNPRLDERFGEIAGDYMRVGNRLGMRWDYAFFQMVVDTGALAFGKESRSGDVRPDQNNFAGLGATGKGERGERFDDIETGVTAHLQHILIYAGQKVPDAVAERTRKVQEWGVLDSWHKSLKGPITFADVARKWAPGASDYPRTIEQVASRFYNDQCLKDDPAPAPMAADTPPTAASEPMRVTAEEEAPKGAAIARKAIAEARADAAAGQRTGLGAAALARNLSTPDPADAGAPAKPAAFTILNAPKADNADDTSNQPPEKPAQKALAAVGKTAAPQAAVAKCRVWQASYGGQRAIIIRSKSDGFTNYTVLDVNDGTEKREAEAYIQAYAKGGEAVGEYNSQALALDKAFDLCPEG